MSYSIQWMTGEDVGVLRHHPHGEFGDDYDWVITLERTGSVAYLHGTMNMSKDIDVLEDFLLSIGIDEVRYVHNGKHVIIKYNGKRWGFKRGQ